MSRMYLSFSAPRLRRLIPCALAVATLGVAGTASADENAWDGDYGQKATRRSDFTIGATSGLFVGRAIGYPNEIEKIDNPRFEADTGLAVGTGGGFWVGAALQDWFIFGLGIEGGTISGNDFDASGGAFKLHVDAFPLFANGGAFEDLGLSADVGIGGVTITRGDDDQADGGAMSFVGAGVFYDGVRLGSGFSLGPNLEYRHMFSETLERDTVQLGVRFVWHGGP